MSRVKSAGSVFLIALCARLLLFCAVLPNPQVIYQPDSRIYTTLSDTLHEHGTFFLKGEATPTYLVRTPGYPLFLYLASSIFGDFALGVILLQILLDSLTCIFIYRLSEMVRPGTGYISGYLASLNLGMITYSHFILSDTLFLFVFSLTSLACFRLCADPLWKGFWTVGLGLGASTIVRPVGMYLPVFFIVFYLLSGLSSGRRNVWPALGRSVIIAVLYLGMLSPWMFHVHSMYGRFALTAQAGEHLLQYVVPSVMQHSRGIPLREGMKRIEDDFLQRASLAGMTSRQMNPFEISEFQTGMAVEYLRSEPKSAILKAWMVGAAKNLFSPAMMDLSYLLRIERPRFFHTEGRSSLDRAWNFVGSMRGWFGWAVVGAMAILTMSRLVQVWGFIRVVPTKKWEALLLLLLIGYFLLVSGPVGYAKYRLPFEPFLIVLLAVGCQDLYERIHLKRSSIDPLGVENPEHG
ncbi:MAG: hypothetical protein C4576_22750 [Desulfobacteraceae bacterium]|nr:MAG: hypothetical protein C4576_22750 [Desulfobacteraceae bacterium]